MAFRDGLNRLKLLSFGIELSIFAAGAYLCYSSIGTPLSNASGSVIRSTVTSWQYAAILMAGAYLFGIDFTRHLFRHWKYGLKIFAAAGLAVTAISTPFLVYYNFYHSHAATISGTTYTVYPMAIQSGLPFMLGIFMAFIAGIMLFAGKGRRVRHYYIRISNSAESGSSTDDNRDQKQ